MQRPRSTRNRTVSRLPTLRRYWPALPGEAESPPGAAFAHARPCMTYHGYLYRVLTTQGMEAPGGSRSYVRDGLMTEGYALIAWPERWGDSGVMSFIVSRDGVVHQKNLGLPRMRPRAR
jgi:hypothetical protein